MKPTEKAMLLMFMAVLLIASFKSMESKIIAASDANPDSTPIVIMRTLYHLVMVLTIVLLIIYAVSQILDSIT